MKGNHRYEKILAWLLVVALTAAIAVGGTLAYLTDTDEDVNVMTLGNVKIDQLEYERVDVETKDENAIVQEFHDNKPLYPAVVKDNFDWTTGDANVDWSQIGKDGYSSGIWDPEKINNEQDKMVFVKNKGSYDAYVRSIFAFEANGYTLDQFKALFHLNINETDWTWEWVETPVSIPGAEGDQTTNYIVATATYNKVLKPGELTEISLSQIALDPSAGNADIEGFGETYQILVKTQAVQTAGFESADEALNKGFGEITTTTIPWESDSPIRGIDLRTALHHLNGDTNNVITKNVTNVVFALNKEYPEIVNSYDGTLVDVEQDVDVYAYYVPNGSNYDIYFLADSTIYSPKDSRTLFAYMTALTSVDTGNFDVSRVETMRRMFRECGKLQTIDVSTWQTGRTTDMNGMFYKCGSLSEMDVSGWDTALVRDMSFMFRNCVNLNALDTTNWDVGNVTAMTAMFAFCNKLSSLEVGNWDVGNVTDMNGMFSYCYNLRTLDVSNWDTGKVTSFSAMFQGNQNQGNMNIENLDVSNWDTSSCTAMNHMFYSCGQLKELDMSNWDVSKVTTFSHMFADCFKMERLDFTGWDTNSCTDMNGMFNNCNSIPYLDVSSFDTQKVVDFGQMFEACYSLKEIKGLENWDTSSAVSFFEMFTSTQLTTLDLSAFETSTVEWFHFMFSGNSKLKTIYVSHDWDTSKATEQGGMFGGCGSLIGGNGTTYNSTITDATYAHIDTPDNPGYFTHIDDKA